MSKDIIPWRVPADMALQYLLDAAQEQLDLNNALRVDFMERMLPYFDALRGVDRAIAQVEILTVANGGNETAAAFGKCADTLIKALSEFRRAIGVMEQNLLAAVGYEAIANLAEYCEALYTVANAYATAAPASRADLQRKIAAAAAAAEPLIAELFKPRQRTNKELDLVGQMVKDRRKRFKTYEKALEDLQRTDPTIYGQYFPHPTLEGRIEYARKLVERLPQSVTK